MRRTLILLLFLILTGCASPSSAQYAADLSWLRGCWIGVERETTMRWLPPRGGGVGLVGDFQDITGDQAPERWLLEQRPQGLILVRPITAPGGPVESFALIGAGPGEATFAGAAGITVHLAGADDRLHVKLETPSGRVTLFDGVRDGCD